MANQKFVTSSFSRKVLFLRHGCTAWNLKGRFQGSSDIPLNHIGRKQAKRAARIISSLKPARIISSDLSRAYDTALPLGEILSLKIVQDVRLRETNGGEWEGLTFQEIEDKFPEEFFSWISGDVNTKAGKGENRIEVANRVLAAVAENLKFISPGETLVVVTHGGVIRVAISIMLGFPYAYWDVFGGLSNSCWSVLEEKHIPETNLKEVTSKNKWRLIEHNSGNLPEENLFVSG